MNTNLNKPSLVILAAGMGSRYGGLKQIDTVGNNGESIIDFTIYDAIKAGFGKVYLIIRKEHEQAFRDNLVDKVRTKVPVEFIYQDLNDLPKGYTVPEGREKPWGTTHALLACKNQVKENFMICNADDFYGRGSFETMYDFLCNKANGTHYGMVGYPLVNTLTDSGSVTRAVCETKDNKLTQIVEIQKIIKQDGKACIEENEEIKPVDPTKLSSMNFWGFTPLIFDQCEGIFVNFLHDSLEGNPMKCEHVIPTAVGDLVKAGACDIEVMGTDEKWFGVTYKEDKPDVVAKIQAYKDQGLYPFDLWK